MTPDLPLPAAPETDAPGTDVAETERAGPALPAPALAELDATGLDAAGLDAAGLDDAGFDDAGPDAPGPAPEILNLGPEAGPATDGAPRTGIAAGVAVIQHYLRTLPGAPGVYRMLDTRGDALYVGKAKNLRKRVYSYTQTARQPGRLLRMIAATRSMEFVVTSSEVEALLLEANLIKRLQPRYNVLLRDDKALPFILLTADHDFPQIFKHRGDRVRPGQYFGPFASAGAVNQTVASLQRGFMLRNCTDAVFATRTRPCLQYQIKRCTAPCAGYVSKDEYAGQVAQAAAFLRGESQTVQAAFVREMEAASERLDFEEAAKWRDRVRALATIQARQDINVQGIGDADAFAIHQDAGQSCVQVYFFRGGSNYGTRAFFPAHDRNLEPPEVLAAFLAQFYDDKPPPDQVLVSHDPPEGALLAEALSIRAGRRVGIARPQRGDRRRLIDHALANAREALARRMAESASWARMLDGVAQALGLPAPPRRIEVYDNSHNQGTDAIGALIVAGPEGLQKNAYRKFNIRAEDAAGDDYAMMREVLGRRFGRAAREDPDRLAGAWPDLVMIDGGQGQLNVAAEVLAELGAADLPLVAIAKGPDRNAGRERFFMAGRAPFSMEARDPVLYFLQRLRDEAHRFAIGTHRAKRAKQIGRTPLDDVPGIGPTRKRALLRHFGSGRAVTRASLADLEAVEGISKAVARTIYDHLRNGA